MSNVDSLPYVEAELNYLAPMTERPRYYAYEPQPGEPRSNLEPEPHQVRIHTLRPIAAELGLDVQGFALRERSCCPGTRRRCRWSKMKMRLAPVTSLRKRSASG